MGFFTFFILYIIIAMLTLGVLNCIKGFGQDEDTIVVRAIMCLLWPFVFVYVFCGLFVAFSRLYCGTIVQYVKIKENKIFPPSFGELLLDNLRDSIVSFFSENFEGIFDKKEKSLPEDERKERKRRDKELNRLSKRN